MTYTNQLLEIAARLLLTLPLLCGVAWLAHDLRLAWRPAARQAPKHAPPSGK